MGANPIWTPCITMSFFSFRASVGTSKRTRTRRPQESSATNAESDGWCSCLELLCAASTPYSTQALPLRQDWRRFTAMQSRIPSERVLDAGKDGEARDARSYDEAANHVRADA